MPTPPESEQLRRWRLILGKDAQAPLDQMGGGRLRLSTGDAEMDAALAAIYDEVPEEDDKPRQRLPPGWGRRPRGWPSGSATSAPTSKEDVVSVIQADAIERKGLTQLLFEPETLKSVQPNIQMVGTLMSLGGRIRRTKETARMVVAAVVEEVKKNWSSGCGRRCSGRSTAASILAAAQPPRRSTGSGPSAGT